MRKGLAKLREVVYCRVMVLHYRTVTGTELLNARKSAGASRAALAREMGVDQATVWRWEKADRVHGHIQAQTYLDALARLAKGKA